MIIDLADGTKFDTVAKRKVEDKTSVVEDTMEVLPVPVPKFAMRLEDLSAAPKVMNVVCAVIGYKLLGMPNGDISLALGCTDEQLKNILEGDIYDKTYSDIIYAFSNGQQNSAKDVLAQASIKAATVLVDIVKTSKNEQNKLKAASDILNRNGIGGEHNSAMGGPGLTIKIIKDHKNDEITISM